MSEHVRQDSLQVSLPWLVRMAETGQLRPAAFSRPQVWSASQVADLFDSIFRGYPIGILLAIEQPAADEDVLLGNILIHAPRDERALILVDGLQRVTALVGALSGTRSQYRDKRFEMCYDIKREAFVSGPPVHASMLPVHIAANSQLLTAWISEHPFLSERENDACWRLYEALNTYTVPMIKLAGAEAWDTAQQIFTRINTSGVSLTRSDLARVRSSQPVVTKNGLEKLQSETERSGFGRLSIELAAECALAVINDHDDGISRQPTWARPQQSFEQMPQALQQQAIDRAQIAMIPTIQFLRQEAAILHIRLLPQSAVLPGLIRFVNTYGPPVGRVKELLRRWVWRYGTVSISPPLQSPTAHGAQRTALDEATSLLGSLPSSAGPAWQPDMAAVSLNRINGRLNALALLSLRPPLLVPTNDLVRSADVPISATQILVPWLDDADSAFCELLPRDFTNRRPISLGSYLLHPPAEQVQLFEAVTSRNRSDTDLLARHCIDRKALSFLKHADFDEFVEYREHQMFMAILHRVQSMARWGFRDHGDLPSVPDESLYSDGYNDEY